MYLWFYFSAEALQKIHLKKCSKHVWMIYVKGKIVLKTIFLKASSYSLSSCALSSCIQMCPSLSAPHPQRCSSQTRTPLCSQPMAGSSLSRGRRGTEALTSPHQQQRCRAPEETLKLLLTVERTRHKLFPHILCLLRLQQARLWSN